MNTTMRIAWPGRLVLPGLRRHAHAAAFQHEHDMGYRGHPRARHHPRATQAGPSRRSSASDYRFPTKGARGGQPSPYEVLGIPRTAGAGEIKAAYYKLALVLHPDSSHPAASAEHFAILARAYKLLSSSAGRNSYLQSGAGWSPSGAESGGRPEDAAMREWARRAKAGGAASWQAGQASRHGFRDSDAGRGAWGYYRTHPGAEDFPFHDKPPEGDGKPIFMGNNRFLALIASLAAFAAVFQVLRVGQFADSHRDILVARHIAASDALAEARREAAMFGKERMDKIRRRVRENAVMEEIAKMERGEFSEHSHGKGVPRVEAGVPETVPPRHG